MSGLGSSRVLRRRASGCDHSAVAVAGLWWPCIHSRRQPFSSGARRPYFDGI